MTKITKKIKVLHLKTFSATPDNFTGKVYLANGSYAYFVNGKHHRDNGKPAIVYANSHQEWRVNSWLHRVEGPAILLSDGSGECWVNGRYEGEFKEVESLPPADDFTGAVKCHGDIRWYKNGKTHRGNDLPAMITAEGDKYWIESSVPHRSNGPAIEYADGSKTWIQHDKLHREGGPAVIHADGEEEYWIENKLYSKKEYHKKLNIKPGKKKSIIKRKWTESIPDTFTGIVQWEVPSGLKTWFKDGKKHRKNGPAVTTEKGSYQWWFQGKLHRLDGPAVKWNNESGYYIHGVKYSEKTFNWKTKHNFIEIQPRYTGVLRITQGTFFCCDGQLHRSNGPAVIEANGKKQYWLEGIRYSKEAYEKKMKMSKPEVFKVDSVEINDQDALKFANAKYNGYFTGIIHTPVKYLFVVNGKIHRNDDLPAIEWKNGNQEWYRHGQRHRDKGLPAAILGTAKYYFVDDCLHRDNGPAIEGPNCNQWLQKGKLHREDGPAKEYSNGKIRYHLNGSEYASKEEYERALVELRTPLKLKTLEHIPDDYTGSVIWENGIQSWFYKGHHHRDLDLPALICKEYKQWFKHGVTHRDNDKPARERTDGGKSWYKDGKKHRDNGPAVEYPNGAKAWYQEDKLHRLDGPGVITKDGEEYYYIKGIEYKTLDLYEKALIEFNKPVKKEESNSMTTPLVVSDNSLIPNRFTGIIHVKDNISNTPDIYYLEKGIQHRLDGPAIEHANGTKEWYQYGQKHREDGPAVEYMNGDVEYWLAGVMLPDNEFQQFTQTKAMNESSEKTKNPFMGSSLEDFLKEEGIELTPEELNETIQKMLNEEDKMIARYETLLKDTGCIKQAFIVSVMPELKNLQTSINDIVIVNVDEARGICRSWKKISDNEFSLIEDNNLIYEFVVNQSIPDDFTGYGILPDNRYVTIKNGFFSKEDISIPCNIKHTVEYTKPDSSTISTLKNESKEAAKRIAVKKTIEFIQSQLIAMSIRGKSKKEVAIITNNMTTYFGTSAGKLTVALALGGVLPFIQEFLPEKLHNVIDVVSTECRIQGMQIAGNELINFIKKFGLPALTSLVHDLSNNDSFKEIEKQNTAVQPKKKFVEQQNTINIPGNPEPDTDPTLEYPEEQEEIIEVVELQSHS